MSKYHIGSLILDVLDQCRDLKDSQMITNREKEVLSFLLKGWLRKEIADKLFISENTVGFHIKNLKSKYKVNRSQELFFKIYEYYTENSLELDDLLSLSPDRPL